MSAADSSAQLVWEARFARPVAVCAFASAVLSLAGFVVPSLTGPTGETIVDQLTGFVEESTTYILGAALLAAGLALLAPVLYYVQRAAGARRA